MGNPFDLLTVQDVKLQNCAGCSKELLSRGKANFKLARKTMRDEMPELVGGTFEERPYCADCLLKAHAEALGERWIKEV
jgi:hypothetical protein